MVRNGPVQSMSVVDFRGIDIKGDCCAMVAEMYRHVYVYLDRRVYVYWSNSVYKVE